MTMPRPGAVTESPGSPSGSSRPPRATSAEPFDAWFREHARDVHGVDLAAGIPLPEQVLDFRG